MEGTIQNLNDIVFKIGNEADSDVSFVHLKLQQFEAKKRTLVQIIDISDKMLYNEVKAEQKFSTLMNGAVSHELRNPLNSILGAIDMMKSYIQNLKYLEECLDQDDDEIVRQAKHKLNQVIRNAEICSNKMCSSSKFLDYFVHDMLDYTILTNDKENFNFQISEFCLQDSIDEIVDIMNDKIEMKQLKLSTQIQNIRVKTDQKRLQQVFLNILANAIKFTDRNGLIDVDARIEDGDMLTIQVKDSGIGIKDTDKPKLFQLFGSVKDAKNEINTNGIGLGLVISNMITMKFNGSIELESQYQYGTTVTFGFKIDSFGQSLMVNEP